MIRLSEHTLFANRFRFKRLLGCGGFSEVWLATDEITGLDIAVKVYAPGRGMDTDGMKDFCKELSQVYNLNHTNLLKPQHVDNWEGMPFLVMTYCPQGSCHRLIGRMSEKQIWKLLHDVSSGLAYLHEQGIVHQDIKPDNILIDPSGNYVITDFGISVKSRSTLRKSMNIASGSGTTAYMGPERFSTDPMPLKSSDIWSLGATAYELLTGNAPFGEIGGGLQKGGADLPTIKQNISPELRTVLSKMLSLATWDRPTAEQLAQWSKTPQKIVFTPKPIPPVKPVPASSKNKPRTAASSGERKGLYIGIAVAVIILIVGGMGLFKHLNGSKDADTPPSEDKIHAHLALKEKCDNNINELTTDNISTLQLEKTVRALRELEDFEKNKLGKKFFQDEMKAFLATLSIISEEIQKTLDEYDKKHTKKKGDSYQEAIQKKELIDKVFQDINQEEDKSAWNIHLRSDDF